MQIVLQRRNPAERPAICQIILVCKRRQRRQSLGNLYARKWKSHGEGCALPRPSTGCGKPADMQLDQVLNDQQAKSYQSQINVGRIDATILRAYRQGDAAAYALASWVNFSRYEASLQFALHPQR